MIRLRPTIPSQSWRRDEGSGLFLPPAQSLGTFGPFSGVQVFRPPAAGGGGWSVVRFAKTTAGSDSVVIDTTGITALLIALRGYTTEITIAAPHSDTVNYRAADGSSGARLRIGDILNPTTDASYTLTVGGGDGTDYRAAIVLACTGNAASPFDTSIASGPVGNWGTGGTNGIQAGSITPAVASSLCLAALTYDTDGTISVDSGFNIVTSTNTTAGYDLVVATKIISAASNPKFTTTAASAGGNAMNGIWKP